MPATPATPTASYITEAIGAVAIALLWQATDASENGGDGFPIGEGGKEYSDRVVAEVPYLTEAVTAFVTDNWPLLMADKIDAGSCGHDLILTANGHGAGFWDRGYAHGDELTEATRGYSFYAEFRLWGEDADGDEHCADEIAWLCVENIVLVDELGRASDSATGETEEA